MPAQVNRNAIRSLDDEQVLLQACKAKGAVVIISNGAGKWIKRFCRKMLPRAWQYIRNHDIKMLSAKDDFGTGTGLPAAQWKAHAFQSVIAEIKAKLRYKRSPLNVLSVGDQNRDGDDTFKLSAITKAAWYCANQRWKFVKFKTDSTLEELTQQVTALHTRVDQLSGTVGPINSTIQDLENAIQI